MSNSSPSKKIKDSREKLQVIINHIRDIITETDLNGNFTYVSPQVYDILGYKPEEVIGLSGFKFIHPEDLSNIASKMSNLMRSEGPMLAEYRALHKDGHYVHISAKGTIVRENGNIKLIAVLRDITIQKETEEKYRFIAENINDMISVFNDKLELMFINETQERISGFSKEEIMGKSPLEFLHPDDIKNASLIFRKALKEGQGRGQFRMRSKDNSYKWMDVNGRVTFDSDGNQRILLVSRDITREKEIEQKYRLLAKNINDIIWTTDLNFKTNYVSPSVKAILGYTVEEDMARSINEKFTPESLKIIGEMIKKHITPKKIKDKNYNPVLRIEGDQYHKNGSIIPCEITVNPMRDKSGIAFGLVGITRDITKRKETEQKLKESELKYRLITINSQDIVYTLDMNLNNTYISPSIFNVLGYDVDEAILMHPRDNTYKDDIEKISRIYKEEFKLERKKDINKDLNRKGVFTIREKHKDGRILTMEHTFSWLRDENGIAVGILGVARDVTEKKNTENLLKESAEKYRTLFENSPHAVGLINLKGVVIQGNSNIEKIFGYKKEEFIGQNFRKFPIFSKEHYAIVLNSLAKLSKGEIPEPHELQIHRKDGSIIWVSMQSSIVKLKTETLFQVITQDISKIKEAEKKLEEQNKELHELNNLKTEFLTRASHELKTPLVAIKGNADLVIKLHHEDLNSEVITMLEAIQRGCNRIEDIIHKLIESSKLETSKIDIHTTKEDLPSLIQFCVNEIQSLVKMRNLTINLDVKHFVSTKFNKDQIHEVISNLLNNAINYSPPGGFIYIKSEVKGNTIIISIEDRGIGFTKDEKMKIFQKFGKINRANQEFDIISEGSGLGLYISKKIIEIHGGKIWVESEGRNKGSTFYFALPII